MKTKKCKWLWWLTGVIAVVGLVLLTDGVRGIQAVGDFITDQILGMKWLNALIGMAFTAMFGETFMSGHWGQAMQFFVYDTIKIVVLLCLLIFLISYIQSYFPPERTKKILGRFQGIGANAVGSLLGTVTPFCSCSSIPLFMGFTRAGLSSGVTFSFLISSPLVDLGAFVLLVSVFGFPIATAYVVVGLMLAIVGGTIIEKTGVGKHIQDYILEGSIAEMDGVEMSQRDRLIYAKDQMLSTLKKVWMYILVGVGIGATIHNFIPAEWIQAVLGSDKWYAVPLATILGTPMYADIFGTIPVAEALFAKGVGVGTILSFMMSVTALSLPSMIMLSKAVKPKLLFWFVFIVVAGIMIIGLAFNALNFLFV
ncbi:MAG: permease [Spirochaetaceae bacterium]|nr:permease [Spirochaetaceae bacterium]